MKKMLFSTAAAAGLLLASTCMVHAEGEVISEQTVAPAQQQAYTRYDQNGQSDKIGFVNQPVNEDMYSSYMLVKQVTPYEVKSGTVIPGVLITGMNSDLPGTVIGQVSENVYDSTEGKYLLIPQGTRVIGKYDSRTTFAQERGLVVWQRLIFPNGKSLILENLQGTDQAGYAGFHDIVHSHYGRVLWSALLGGLITGGVAVAADVEDNDSFRGEAGSQAASNISSATNSIVNKNLNIQPTIIIEPGYQYNIIVSRDLILEPYVD